MRYLFILVFLLPIICLGQNTLLSGTGIIKVDFTSLPTIKFYSDTLQSKPSKSVSIIKQGEFALKNESEVRSWFKPEQLFLEYDIFILRVDTIIGKWAKVYIDNKKASKLWTKIDTYEKYFSWNNFFKTQVTNITTEKSNIAIKQFDNESSKTIKIMEKEDCFEIIEVKGDWLKIKTHSILECSTSKRPIEKGWLKWRQNNKLTIQFGLAD